MTSRPEGAETFINKGNKAYKARAVQERGADCARWLATGERQGRA